MKIEQLTKNRLNNFFEYCRRHKSEIDDSFLYDEDLKKFKLGEENPTYVIINEKEEIIAAASLIIDEYMRKGKNGRFRIFHSEIEDIECFKLLMAAILKHTEGLDKVCIFIPIINKELIKAIESLKFKVERYSFLLIREDGTIPESNLPQGYEQRAFTAGRDEETWCQVRNAAFANLKGSETPKTPEMIKKMFSSNSYIEGGIIILYHNDMPVGLVQGSKDDYEGSPIMNIGPLAIIPEYQGKGLGRYLLRTALKFAQEKGYDKTILCVNAENERAKALYLQEGFKQVEAVVCYKYDLSL